MADLEHDLRRLASEIEWPPTPALVLRSRRRSRRPLVLAVAVVVAVAAAFAVPQSRGALLRFFHLGGVSVERVDTLPPASLRRSLGVPVGAPAAARLLGRPFAIAGVPLYRAGRAVSAVVDGALLLSELNVGDDVAIFKKYYATGTAIDSVSLTAGTPALWLHGRPHVVVVPPVLPPRYAGNTLVWLHDGITYRLEGRGLTLARARAIALETLR
jgi:hypothetical protein